MVNLLSRIAIKLNEPFVNAKNPLGKKIRDKRLTYLNAGALLNLKQSIDKVESKKVQGIFIETGCALGGSTIQIGEAKNSGRVLRVYDVFGMIPPPSDRDDKDVIDRYEEIKQGKSKGLKGDEYYGYQNDLRGKVEENLMEFGLHPAKENIELIQGLYEETLRVDEPVAFAHIDCDWYDSVMTCLNQIEPKMTAGGIMVIDDYFDWSGCRKAVDDYFTPELKSQYSFTKRYQKLILEKK
jgi:asparagine synthase (glutamine-hydrolysing)